ncbi:uncharacterized protein LOC110987358 isoform X2 [Acanthaster planci]|uniref:Uncharacterized protein LOC110987358 isoform X2 n=1 Tax=Acanthaster planci TaxID=133434 RepID=A0A8B7ZJE3_ACAPL|nr:uncharacterized protein LOC110987358 isoform X2 [Acanthaster planci]
MPASNDQDFPSDLSAEDGGQDKPVSHYLSCTAADVSSEGGNPAQSAQKPSRMQSVLSRLFWRSKQRDKGPSSIGQQCQRDEMTSQVLAEIPSRPSPRHHQAPEILQVLPSAKKKPSSRLQSVLRKVNRKKKDCEGMPGVCVEQSSGQRAVQSNKHDQPSDGEEKVDLSTQQVLTKGSHPVEPDRAAVVHFSPRSACHVETLNVTGDENPCFFGPMYGPTFNLTVVSAPKDQGEDKREIHSHDAVFAEMPVASSNSDRQPGPYEELSATRKLQEATLAEAAADLCEKALQSRYTTTGSYVQIIPWLEDDTKHIMDIYTGLQVVGDYIKGKLKSYKGIFLVETREGNVIKRIILDGQAGVGKSTLIAKVTYDWAMKCVSVLLKYKLVFALKMHSLEQSSELVDAVFAQLLDRDTPIDKCALKSFINTNPEKVLILLDGFDEFTTTDLNESTFGSILKILNRKECRDCCVVVTTRSSHLSKLVNKLLVQKPFTHVRVLGFSAEDVNDYISKFYSKEPEKAQRLCERIQSSDVLRDLARSPMLLLVMCVLWREDSSLPDTMYRLYSEVLRYMFKRKAGISNHEVSKVVVELGKIAFHGLISPVQLLSFKQSEFVNSTLNTALRVGLVTSQRVMKGLDTLDSIQFMHMTFQEFSAAKYFQSLLKTSPEEFQKILKQLENAIKNHPAGFEYLLRFCCGDSQGCTAQILKMLQNTFSNSALKLALMCFFESQSKSIPSQDLVSAVLSSAVHIEDCNSDSLNSHMWFVKQVMEQPEGHANAKLASVAELAVCRCNLQRWDTSLTHCLKGLSNLSILVLKECSLSVINMQHIAASIGKLVNLTLLDLSGNECLGGSVPSWVLHLHVLKRLEKLNLEDCHLNRKDVRSLAVSVGHIGSLHDCSVQTDVHRRSPADDLVWPTNRLVSETEKETSRKRGIRLDITECSLTGSDMAEIMEALTRRKDLVELVLSRNNGLGGSATLWFNPLMHLKSLQELVLSNCLLKDSDIEYIAVSLSGMPLVAKLDLSQNSLGGLGGSWASHFQIMTHLQKLSLKYCSLTGEDAKLLAISLSCLANLTKLDLSFNESLGGSAGVWAPCLDQMRSLQKLYLRQCALSSKDVKYIAMSLSSMASCKDLNLSSNELLSASAGNWSPHLRRMHHLKNLILLGCNLNKQDLRHLATSFSYMPNLVNCLVKSAYLSGRFLVEPTKTGIRLDLSQRSLTGKDLAFILEAVSNRNDLVEFILSGNVAVSGSAALWSPYLKQLRRLERLELHHCSLQPKDIEHIALMLEDMTSLTKLDLSLNDTLGGSGKLWAPQLKLMKHLQMLDLSSCDLTGVDMKNISVSLCDLPNLKGLKVSDNDSLGGTASLWSVPLQSLNHLEMLEFDECNIKRQEFKYVAASIGLLRNLVNCSVRSNYMGSRFQFSIQPVSSGIHVYLSDYSLTGTNLADILEGLSSRSSDLVELSLVGNDALANSASLWSFHLKQLKNLQVLVLNRCSMLGSDVEQITLTLSSMPSLRALELSGNMALGGACNVWAPFLYHVKHIQELHLSCCSLMPSDMKHIAEACSVMPALSELDLTGNEALSGSAALWAPHLKQMKHLCNLRFQECLLTGEDKQHIARCLSLNESASCFI